MLAIALITGSVGIRGIVELMRQRTADNFFIGFVGICFLVLAVWCVLWFVERANMPFTF